MKFTSFKSKLTLTVGLVAFISYMIIILYTGITISNRTLEAAKKDIVKQAQKHAFLVQDDMDKAFMTSITLAKSLAAIQNKNSPALTRKDVNQILERLLLDNPDFMGTYTLWEPNAFDNQDALYANTAGHDATGRFVPYWTRGEDNNIDMRASLFYTTAGFDKGDYYLIPTKRKREVILEPAKFPIQGKDVLLTSLIAPVLRNNKSQGIFGVDITIDHFQKKTEAAQQEMYDGEIKIVVLSNKGRYVANTANPELVGEVISTNFGNKENTLRKIQEGKTEIEKIDDAYTASVPVIIGNTQTPWQIQITVAESVILHKVRKGLTVMILLACLFGVAGVVLISLIIGRITRPLSKLADKTKGVAEGKLDMNIDINRTDELGLLSNSFSSMISKLRTIITSIKVNSTMVSDGSSQISTSAQQIAQGANMQSISTENIHSAIRNFVGKIDSINGYISANQEKTTAGVKSLEDAQNSTEYTLNSIENIAKDIISIQGIAKKTDILAINAAIEAAKAGETGRGFSVVANEVRKLAEQTRETSNRIFETTQDSVNIAHKSDLALKGIVEDAKETFVLIQKIVEAGEQQKQDANNINTGVQELSTIVQQNSATAEELSTSAEELASQSVALTELISYFSFKGTSETDPIKAEPTGKRIDLN